MFPLPPNTFDPVELTPKDVTTLESLADYFVQETILKYQDHLYIHNGVVDTSQWKKIKQREDVRVYRQRYPEASSNSGGSRGGAHECAEKSQDMPHLMTFGTIPGNLDDVMYGVSNPTTESMRLKSAYVGDGFVDWGVLASLIKPSPEDPFRELSIKWTVKGHSLLIGAVMRLRDTVYIESTGITQMSDGERIGYHLQHSVDLPAARELREYNIVRCKVSFCHLFRQRKENVVEVFVRGLLSIMGDAPASLAALTAADVSVSVWKNVHCAQMKKLAWLVRTSKSTNSGHSRSQGCSVCSKTVKSGFGVMTSKDKMCQLCLEPACAHCRVTHTINFTSVYSPEVIQRKMTFCTSCMQRASRTDPVHVAVAEILGPETGSFDLTASRVSSNSSSSAVPTEVSSFCN